MRLGGQVEHGRRPMLGEHARDRVAIGDVAAHERHARIVERSVEVQQAARVGQLVDDDEAVGGVVEGVANEVGADEPGAAGDEQSAHGRTGNRGDAEHCSASRVSARSVELVTLDRRTFRIQQREPQLLRERIDGRAAALPRAFGLEAQVADAAAPRRDARGRWRGSRSGRRAPDRAGG